MVAVTCEFHFARPSRVYYDNDEIVGHCVLRAAAQNVADLRTATLKFTGFCQLKWRVRTYNQAAAEQHNDSDIKPIEFEWHSVDEEFFGDLHTHVPLDWNASDKCCTIPIRFVVPANEPPTVHLPCITISYRIQVVIPLHGRKKNKFSKSVFIKRRLDLNDPPMLALLKHSYPKSIRSDCLYFAVDQAAYVPGQSIRYWITAMPNDAKLYKIVVMTTQRVKCKGRAFLYILSKNKHSAKKLPATIMGSLVVPLTVPISSLEQYAHIQISYDIQCVMLNRKRQVIHTSEIPIVIGTVPLPLVGTLAEENPTDHGYLHFTNYGADDTFSRGTDFKDMQTPAAKIHTPCDMYNERHALI